MLTLLKNGQVYAPAPLGKRDLLLGGGKILQIADRLDPPEGWAVEVVDADGRVLLTLHQMEFEKDVRPQEGAGA